MLPDSQEAPHRPPLARARAQDEEHRGPPTHRRPRRRQGRPARRGPSRCGGPAGAPHRQAHRPRAHRRPARSRHRRRVRLHRRSGRRRPAGWPEAGGVDYIGTIDGQTRHRLVHRLHRQGRRLRGGPARTALRPGPRAPLAGGVLRRRWRQPGPPPADRLRPPRAERRRSAASSSSTAWPSCRVSCRPWPSCRDHPSPVTPAWPASPTSSSAPPVRRSGMGGPPMVEAALGMRLSANQLAGVEMHERNRRHRPPRGRRARRPSPRPEAVPGLPARPGRRGAVARPRPASPRLVPAEGPYDIGPVIDALVDDGQLLRAASCLRPCRAVTGFARLGGRSVGVLASQPAVPRRCHRRARPR